jgi:hypothetical protein
MQPRTLFSLRVSLHTDGAKRMNPTDAEMWHSTSQGGLSTCAMSSWPVPAPPLFIHERHYGARSTFPIY